MRHDESALVLVAMLGARMHYAVPRILAQASLLERFYTDFSASQGWPRFLSIVPQGLQPEKTRRLLGRDPQGISPERVTAFNSFGLAYAVKLSRARSTGEKTALFLSAGREFCRRILARGFGNASAVYTFNSAGLELLQAAKRRGLLGVMEQTSAPREIERRILAEEQAKFSDWEAAPDTDLHAQEYADRERAEWEAADRILCGSEFVRDGIRGCGGPAEKCVVIPYGVDLPVQSPTLNPQPSTPSTSRPLRVLTVGTVGLHKGTHYVLESAKPLKGQAEFRAVGRLTVLPKVANQLRKHVELTGSVPRSEMAEHFKWADIFLLPSLSEGSATVTYEALGYGLPVICTPNTGSVVRDGVEGFIVPPFDAASIIARIEYLARRPELLAEMSSRAIIRAREFDLANYSSRLLDAIR